MEVYYTMPFSKRYPTFEEWLKVQKERGKLNTEYVQRIIRLHEKYPEATLLELAGHGKLREKYERFSKKFATFEEWYKHYGNRKSEYVQKIIELHERFPSFNLYQLKTLLNDENAINEYVKKYENDERDELSDFIKSAVVRVMSFQNKGKLYIYGLRFVDEDDEELYLEYYEDPFKRLRNGKKFGYISYRVDGCHQLYMILYKGGYSEDIPWHYVEPVTKTAYIYFFVTQDGRVLFSDKEAFEYLGCKGYDEKEGA